MTQELDLRSAVEKENTEDIKQLIKRRPDAVQEVFVIALQQPQKTKETIMHSILSYYVEQNTGNVKSIQEVIKHLEIAILIRMGGKKNPIKNPNKEYYTFINFKDYNGNTLLHHAVKEDNTEAIETLLKYGANPLITDVNGEKPLDLATGNTRYVLIKGMRDQASLFKDNARGNAILGGLFGTVIGIGAGVGAAASLSGGAMLGVIAASAIVACIVFGIATYFLSQDYKQAREIEKVLPQENKVDSVTPAAGTALEV